MQRRLLSLWLGGVSFLHAAVDPSQALLQIRRQIAAQISRLPNYLCTETVERLTLEPDMSLHPHTTCEQLITALDKPSSEERVVSSDRLRLDVALNSRTEMYSWVGEGKFDDRDLSEIVKQGTTSTGAFGSFLHAIFASDSPTFSFKGEGQVGGRPVLEYTFVVPITRSGYIVSNQTINRLTGYTGSFTADAKTLDLLRLEIRTDPLAPELHICRSSTALDYTQVKMSGVDVLLPSKSTVRMLSEDGHESHNSITFSGCHQFMGESKLIFDDQPTETNASAAATAAAKAKTLLLPEGLKVAIALTQNINPTTAAAGDPVSGKLTKAIKDPASGLLVPKGAKVNGRIFGLVFYYKGVRGLEFGLKWESFEMDGVRHPLDLLVKSAGPMSANLPMARGRFPEISAQFRPEQRGVGFFLLPVASRSYEIPTGFETEWVTLPAANER